jgi:integrase
MPSLIRLTKTQTIDALNALNILRKTHPDATLTMTAQDFVRREPSTAESRTIRFMTVCHRFLATIPKEHERTYGSYRSVIRIIFRTLDIRILASALTESHVLAILALYRHPVTYTSMLRRIKAIINWGYRRRLMAHNPAAKIEAKKAPYKEPSFFYPEKVEKIFAVAGAYGTQEIRTFLTLGFYAGLRTAEIFRTRWSEIDLEDGTLRVSKPKGITSGTKPRIVELEPKALALLKICRALYIGDDTESDDIFTPSSDWRVSKWKQRHLKPCGLSWGNDGNHNVMRHTYATMHVAAFQNAAKTALYLGHSEGSGILDKHYKGLISRSKARTYWNIQTPIDGILATRPGLEDKLIRL